MTLKTRILIALICLSIVDVVIPVPILGVTLIYVLLRKPRWFPDVVRQVYEG